MKERERVVGGMEWIEGSKEGLVAEEEEEGVCRLWWEVLMVGEVGMGFLRLG